LVEIKSALELALEKAERYGKASQEEMAAAQYQEQGRQLAVEYLKGEGDLEAGLKGLPPQAQAAARAAIKEVLLRNIGLPRNGEADPRLGLAVAGLMLVAGNQKLMDRLKAELEQLLQQFLQIRNNAFQQLKARLAAGIGQVQRAMEAQLRQKVRLRWSICPSSRKSGAASRAKCWSSSNPCWQN
jgi:hypothetical protein